MRIPLVIIEDDIKVREGLEQMLNFSDELNVLETFGDAESFMEKVHELKPEVALMDIGLPGISGIECVEIMKQKMPEIQFLMCTNFDDDQKVFDALQAGANGYVLKNSEIQTIIQSISEVHRGGSPMSRSIARKVIESFHSTPIKEQKYDLSKRESEILKLLSKGYRYKEIAAQLQTTMDSVTSLIRFATQQRVLIDLGNGFLMDRRAFGDVCRDLTSLFDEKSEQTVSEIRDHLQITRKYAIPLLEYCDAVGITVRDVDTAGA